MEGRTKDQRLKLVVQTKTQNVKEELVLINHLFNEGLEQLNLYKPDFSYKEMKQFISGIDAAYHSRIMLYSHYSLVKKFDLGGVHINHRFLEGAFAKIWWWYVIGHKNIRVSTTVNSVGSLKHCPAGVSEILLGPVFVNSGNDIINMSFKRDIFERGIQKTNNNVIVMGGVCEKNLGYLKSLQIKGVLLRSTVWDALDPVKAFAGFRDTVYQIQA